MKQLLRLTAVLSAFSALAAAAIAGTETYSGKEMKQVAPAPPPMCEWGGFYVGLHAGGEFGHSEIHELDLDVSKGFSESGFNGGGQFGYNFQWHWLVLGPEFDVGYMDLNGDGTPVTGVNISTTSSFYTALRGRIGVALDWHGCWLIYGTGGAIGVDYTTRIHVAPDVFGFLDTGFDARRTDFDWGYTVGGGIERMLGRHWSLKAEYLYFSLNEQDFSNTQSGVTGHLTGETFGHIVRAGLNYHF